MPVGNACSPKLTRPFWLLGFIVALFLSCASKAETYQAFLSHYPPNQYEENGEAKGFNVDLIRAVFDRLGHKLEIRFVPWARVLGSLKSGASDLAFAFYVPERTAYLDYSKEPITDFVISLFSHRDSDIVFDGDLAALQDKTIAAVRHTSYGGSFNQAIKDGQLPGLVLTPNSQISAGMLLNKRVDLMVAHRFGAEHLFADLGRRNEIQELFPPLQAEKGFVVFSKAKKLTKLRQEVDQALTEMRQDGSYQRLLAKTFQEYQSKLVHNLMTQTANLY